MVLLLVTLLAAVAASAPSPSDRPCNSILTTVTTTQLQSLMAVTRNALGLSEESSAIFLDNIHYDILVSKVCGSACLDNDDDLACLETYGSNVTLSALALHPLMTDDDVDASAISRQQDDPLVVDRIISASMNGFVGYRGFYTDPVDQAPTENFPLEFSQAVAENAWSFDPNTTNLAGERGGYQLFNSLLGPLLAASSGAIGILPDDVGTGESLGKVDRSFSTVVPNQQATIAAWKAVQNYTTSITNGCTSLNNVASLAGYSAAGYKVMVGADALSRLLGVEILQVMPGAGTYDTGNVAFAGLAGLLAQGGALSQSAFTPLSFYMASFSNPNATYLPNVVAGENMASLLWTLPDDPNNIVDWWMGPRPLSFAEMVELQPSTTTEQASMMDPSLFNQSLVAVFGGIVVCDPALITNGTALLCQAINENSAYPILATAQYPIEWCHSVEDDVVPYAFYGEAYFPPNPMIAQYMPPFDDLAPRGFHAMADNLCSGAVAYYLQRSDGVFMIPIETGNNGQECPAVIPSAALMPEEKSPIDPEEDKDEDVIEGNRLQSSTTSSSGAMLLVRFTWVMLLVAVLTAFNNLH